MNHTDCKCQVVAAFDFDGTLTYRDTLLPFLIYTHGLIPAFRKLIMLSPTLIAYLFGKVSRQQAKESILTQFYAGISLEELHKKGKKFAENVLDKYVKPEAKKRLQWHLKQGHRCILISASLDIYLTPWAKLIGIHDVISSQMQTTTQGIASGCLSGLNCWGPEKLRRLYELIGPRKSFILYAYGDSQGDQELLASADYAFYREMPKTVELK